MRSESPESGGDAVDDGDDGASERLLPSSSSSFSLSLPSTPQLPPLSAAERQRAFAAASAAIRAAQNGRGNRSLTATELQQWLRRGVVEDGALELMRRRPDAQAAAASWFLPSDVPTEVEAGERHRSPCIANLMGVCALVMLVAGYFVAVDDDGSGNGSDSNGNSGGDHVLLWTGLSLSLMHVFLTACSPNALNKCM